jgi:glycosyltransferase involved in cell wall biosynthesis
MNNPVEGVVSIIIPVFNAEKFLAAAVQSVLAQTFSRWELFLIDDGSRDRSPEIAKALAASDSRIHYLEHPDQQNHGMCSTRNLGVQHSRGEFVALLDADDFWLPNKLDEQFRLMAAHPEAAMVCGDSIYIEEDGSPIADTSPFLESRLYAPLELLKLCYPLGTARSPCPSSFFMRRELVDRVGGFEQGFDHLALYEDQVFLAKVYVQANVFISNCCWDKYRFHSESYTARAKREGTDLKMRGAYLAWLEGYLRERAIYDPAIWKPLRRHLRPFRYPRLARVKRAMMRTIAGFRGGKH